MDCMLSPELTKWQGLFLIISSTLFQTASHIHKKHLLANNFIKQSLYLDKLFKLVFIFDNFTVILTAQMFLNA